MILANNIRYLRRKRNWSQDYIAEKLGYKSYTTIQKWEMGISDPPLKKLKELADLLQVDIDELTKTDMSRPVDSSTNKRATTINVLGRVAAGIPIDAIEDIIDTEEITEEMAKTGYFFGLQIHGDSMEPKMSDGDVVIVRCQDDAESDETVIALVNGNEATCKKLKKYDTGIALLSTNPKYEPMYFSNEEIAQKPVKIIGKVVELRAKF